MILVENIKDIWCAKQAQSQEKRCYQGWEDAEDNHYFIIELEHVSTVTFAVCIVWQLSYSYDIVNCPDAIGDIVEGIQEE